MKLREQVVSPELSVRLHALLDKKPESAFYWDKDAFGEVHLFPQDQLHSTYAIAAFTVAELGVMLPRGTYTLWFPVDYQYQNYRNNWCCLQGGKCVPDSIAETEVDARAKMLIHLIEQKIVVL